MVGLAYTSEAWQLIALFSVMGLVGMSGPGALTTSVPPSKWFVRNRGKALAVTAVGISLGALIFVPLTQIFIDRYTWSTSWIILAIVGIVIVVPLSVIFVRRQPEDMGLLPDGDTKTDDPDIEDPNDEFSWTLKQAVKTRSMWFLTIAFSILSLGILTLALSIKHN